MINEKKLGDVFSLTSGIFLRMKNYTDIPWGSDSTLARLLDRKSVV